MTFQHASWRTLLQGLTEFLALSSSAHLIQLPGWPDLNGRLQRDEYSLRPGDSMLVGLAQAVAIVPGTWRSVLP
jgi:undecaprenyl pyrophosphate phosphatase UppP